MDNIGPRSGFARSSMALDVVAAAFVWLPVGPEPIGIDGRRFAGLPDGWLSLGEVRERLLAPSCPPSVRDAVWAHLVAQSRAEGGGWTVGCAGVALPALIRITATLTARFAGDPADVHAAVLAGFLGELAVLDAGRPRIMLRLRWAAYRAGLACVREALDAPTPTVEGLLSVPPSAPAGHPDLVLARAVADGVLTAAEAELIGSTRLEGVSLAEAAQRRQAGYEATKKARQRAERRLVAYLRSEGFDITDRPEATPHMGRSIGSRVGPNVGSHIVADTGSRLSPRSDAAERKAAAAVPDTPGDDTARTAPRRRSVTEPGHRRSRTVRRRMSRSGGSAGVQQGRGTPASTASLPPDAGASAGVDPSAEVSRCA